MSKRLFGRFLRARDERVGNGIDVKPSFGAVLVVAAQLAMGCSTSPVVRTPVVRPAISSSTVVASATPAAGRQEEHRPWSLRPPVGLPSPDEAVVHVVSKGVECSGTLITNALVLTAHHCVVQRDEKGEILEKDLPASALEVELGGDDLPWAKVKVSALLTPGCGYRGGNGDIAILVLSRKLVGLAMMPVRIGEPPRIGETVEPVGFGHCALSNDGVHHLRRRAGGPIEDVGGGSIFASTSICPGDSGGPARSRITGEVVGVVSAGVMDDSDQTRDPTTFTRLDTWRPLFARAQLIVDGLSPAEFPAVGVCQSN
jgi:hypothetical protein